MFVDTVEIAGWPDFLVFRVVLPALTLVIASTAVTVAVVELGIFFGEFVSANAVSLIRWVTGGLFYMIGDAQRFEVVGVDARSVIAFVVDLIAEGNGAD